MLAFSWALPERRAHSTLLLLIGLERNNTLFPLVNMRNTFTRRPVYSHVSAFRRPAPPGRERRETNAGMRTNWIAVVLQYLLSLFFLKCAHNFIPFGELMSTTTSCQEWMAQNEANEFEEKDVSMCNLRYSFCYFSSLESERGKKSTRRKQCHSNHRYLFKSILFPITIEFHYVLRGIFTNSMD